VSGSCIGRTIDSNRDYISISSWSDTSNPIQLSDDKDTSPLNTSIANKGEYILQLSCDRDDGTISETKYSNEVKVRVIQPIIQEK
jgi:uncharacterized protein YqjF (DUF2071 family)